MPNVRHAEEGGLMSDQNFENQYRSARFLTARLQCGRRLALERGVMMARPPYAYTNEHRPRGVFRIDDAEAATVSRIFSLVADGADPDTVGSTLAAEGWKHPRGRDPATESAADLKRRLRRAIERIVRNPLYSGLMCWGRTRSSGWYGSKGLSQAERSEWIVVEHPELAIVSRDVWQAANTRLDARTKPRAKRT
jgi:site-specific DNA recombinase